MDEGLALVNGLSAEQARERLRACCAATAWLSAVVAGRPYPDRSALQETAATALRALPWEGVREAIDVHPRIGERVAASTAEAAWSAAEQSGMARASAETRAALVEANRAYEERFGHVFLIFATGKTDEQMVAAARERLHHSEATERETVRSELGQIVRLRIEKLLDESAPQASPELDAT
jgi:2-oxo-4-hydroxy-4-carboxy-5-ureidoimidazoline decarboxylase